MGMKEMKGKHGIDWIILGKSILYIHSHKQGRQKNEVLNKCISYIQYFVK